MGLAGLPASQRLRVAAQGHRGADPHAGSACPHGQGGRRCLRPAALLDLEQAHAHEGGGAQEAQAWMGLGVAGLERMGAQVSSQRVETVLLRRTTRNKKLRSAMVIPRRRRKGNMGNDQTVRDLCKQVYHGEENDEGYLLMVMADAGTPWCCRKSLPESSPET